MWISLMLIFVHGDPMLHFGNRAGFEVNDSSFEAFVGKIADKQYFDAGDRYCLLHRKNLNIKP